jgi:hypothetical protein
MHNNGNMIIHILPNIPQKASGKNTNTPKRNARKINILITSSIGLLSRQHNQIIRGLIPSYTGDRVQQRQQAGACVFDCSADICFVCDAELVHGTADHLRGVGDEFVNEDVVVDAVADRTADHTDGECECCDGGDEVVGADDCGDD